MKRISLATVVPEMYKAMLRFNNAVSENAPDKILIELIKIRASQINGCAYCIDMHTHDALKMNVPLRKLFAIAAWRESPLFSEKEKIAFRLTEEVTQIGIDGLTDATYEMAIQTFGEQETARLIMQTIVINSWNRIAIASKSEYEPGE